MKNNGDEMKETSQKLIEGSQKILEKIEKVQSVVAELVIEGAIGKENKVESFKTTKGDKKTANVKEAILGFLKSNGPATRSQIAQALFLKDSSVCGRLNELQRDFEIVEQGTQWDAETKRNVTVYAALKGV